MIPVPVPLFLDLGEANTQEEILRFQGLHRGQLDSHFVALCVATGSFPRAFKAHLEGLWTYYAPYADRDFLDRFRKREFHQRTWEMYLGCLFLEREVALENYRTKKKSAGPDLKVQHEDSVIWVEAIAPIENEETKIPWEAELDEDDNPTGIYGYGGNIEEIDHPRVLKITAAFVEKFTKYQHYLEVGLVGASDPCVIAINGGDFEGWESDGRDILTALFGVGELVCRLRTSGENEFFHRSKTEVPNRNSEPVPTALFMNPEHADISAVIYTGSSVMNSFGGSQKLAIFLNPYAKNVIPRGACGFLDSYELDSGKGQILHSSPITSEN